MTRVGWIMLGLIALLAILFVSLTRFGGTRFRRPSASQGVEQTSALLGVPVAGIPRGAIRDTWGEARANGRVHHGTDIVAPGGTPVLAAASGTIEKLFHSTLGGITVYERSPARRWTYYYAHLAEYAPGLHEGQRVRAGETIGYVGDTGDAGPGNFHLHFGLTRTTPDQRWWEGEDVDAYPLLAGPGSNR